MPLINPQERERPWSSDTRLVEAQRLLQQGTFSVLSVDVFDTLLWRTVPEPVDAFVLLGHHLRDLGRLSTRVAPELFATLRERAELRARRREQERLGDEHLHTGVEVSLEDIYNQLPDHLFPGWGKEDVAKAEIELDARITFPDLDVVALLRGASATGVQVVLVSDTYYSEQQLRRLVDHEHLPGVQVHQVFSSSQHGRGKGFGLFDLVLERLGVQPSQVLHVGDNEEADVRLAQRAGIRAVHYEKVSARLRQVLEDETTYRRAGRPPHKRTLDPVRGDFGITSLRAKVVHQLEASDVAPEAQRYWRFGASVLGPAFTAFAEWVHRRAAEEGTSTVHCVMREGEFLTRLVNGASHYLDSPIRARPLWLSRQVTSRAAIIEGSSDELAAFMVRRAPPTVREFCQAVGIDLARLPALEADADSPLDHADVATRLLRTVTGQPAIRAAIVEGAAGLRARLTRYVLSSVATMEGMEGKVLLVDLGWGGTIQANLATALAGAGADLETVGLYLMTNHGLWDRLLDGLRCEGFLATGSVPDDARWAMRTPEILEQVCMTDTGSLVDIDESDQPVLGPVDQPPTQQLQRSIVQRGVLAFQEQWARYASVIPAEARSLDQGSQPLLNAVLRRFFVSPTSEEVGLFAGWAHDQNYGSESSESVVVDELAPLLDYMTPEQLLEIPMNRLYWPSGLATRYNRPLSLAVAAVAEGTVPADAFAAVDPVVVDVYLDTGGGFVRERRVEAGPNVNGLSYLRAEIGRRSVRAVMLRFSDGPGVLRLDRLTFTFGVDGLHSGVRIAADAAHGLAPVRLEDCAPLAANLVVGARQAPGLVLECPVEHVPGTYKVEIEAAFAWLEVPQLRAGPVSRVEAAAEVARRVTGRVRKVWRSAELQSGARVRPQR